MRPQQHYAATAPQRANWTDALDSGALLRTNDSTELDIMHVTDHGSTSVVRREYSAIGADGADLVSYGSSGSTRTEG